MSAVMKFAAVLGLMAAAAALPAQAQTAGGYLLPSSPSGTLTVNTGLGGWSFTISSCGETLNNVANTACSNAEVIPTLLNGTLSLVFVSGSGGALETSAPGYLNDISLTVNVTGPVTGILSTSFAIVATPSGTGPHDITRISAGDGTTYNGNSYVNLLVGTAGPTLASATFAPITASVTSVLDLRNQGAGVFGPAPGTGTLTSAMLTYSAPEPVSSSLLAVGLIGVGFARRKLRRPV